jgi:isochorismate synthase EntC
MFLNEDEYKLNEAPEDEETDDETTDEENSEEEIDDTEDTMDDDTGDEGSMDDETMDGEEDTEDDSMTDSSLNSAEEQGVEDLDDEDLKKYKLFKQFSSLLTKAEDLYKIINSTKISDFQDSEINVYKVLKRSLDDNIEKINFVLKNNFQTFEYKRLLTIFLYVKVSIMKTAEMIDEIVEVEGEGKDKKNKKSKEK